MSNPKTANELARTLLFHVETGLTQARMAKAKNAMEVSIVGRGEIDRRIASAIEQYKEIQQKLAAVESAPRGADCPNCEASAKEVARLRNACAKQNHEIEQTIARALGYSRFADDPKNWPDAAAEDSPDVCVGEHVAETLAAEIAEKYAAEQVKIVALTSRCEWLGSQFELLCDESQQLRGEKARLFAVARAFVDETVGLEITDAGRQLLETVAAFRDAQGGK